MKRSFLPYLPLLVLIGLLVGLALVFLGLHLATPFGNGRISPGANAITALGVLVTPLDAGPAAGLQAGDLVTAVEGRLLEDWLVGRSPGPEARWQVGETVNYRVVRNGVEQEVPVTLATYPLGAVLSREWGALTYYSLFLLIAGYVFLRRPHLAAARVLFLGAAAQFSAMTWSLGLQVGDFVNSAGLWLYHLTTLGGFMLAFIAYFHFSLLFPRPADFLTRRRWLLLIYGLPYLLLALYFLFTHSQSSNLLDWMGRWGWITGLHAAVFMILSLVTIFWQYRRSQDVTRHQIRWLVLAALLVAGSAVLFYFLPPFWGGQALSANLIGLIGVIFPLAIAVSILRHNLFDIDALLNRALVYSALTVAVAGLYVLVVGLLGTLLQAQGNLFVALLATGVIAVLFQPLRERLQQSVDRFMYGQRDEPFEVLARLGQRLESTLSPEMIYPAIVETVSQALKLPYVAVAVWRDGQLETAESYGKPISDPISYPLTYQGELVGQLLVARRAPEEDFSLADERILRNIARQAGSAVHAVRLMADLQRSRQQLVTAREEERRRLRRDLHDGLGPHLASQTLTIDAVEKLLERDPQRAKKLLQDLKAQSWSAVQDIRRLVYNLRPPALDELGLVGALREGADRQSQNGLRIMVQAPSPLPYLPAAVEVAAYRVAQEAVTNVVRHAGATSCVVTFLLEQSGKVGKLQVTVKDDGRGLPADYQPGVGLQSMRERAAELGGSCHIETAPEGGVWVTAVFPLPEVD